MLLYTDKITRVFYNGKFYVILLERTIATTYGYVF